MPAPIPPSPAKPPPSLDPEIRAILTGLVSLSRRLPYNLPLSRLSKRAEPWTQNSSCTNGRKK